jgi:putative transposase
VFRHKNIRLPSADYIGLQTYFVTICCFARERVFDDPEFCTWLLEAFRAESATRKFAIHAYCLMPDHFHFLAEGLEPSSDLRSFVQTFKLKSSRAYRQRTSRILWQKKFFDRILRTNESPDSVAWYIWLNPVWKGLASRPGAYPFAGSFTAAFPLGDPPASVWSPPLRSWHQL